jgi:hypothetical protein
LDLRWTLQIRQGKGERRDKRQSRGRTRWWPLPTATNLAGDPRSSDSGHQNTRDLHHSNQELKANSSTLFRQATSVRGRDAAWDGDGAIAGSRKLRKLTIQSTIAQKKSMGRKRRRWRAHQKGRGDTRLHIYRPSMSCSVRKSRDSRLIRLEAASVSGLTTARGRRHG